MLWLNLKEYSKCIIIGQLGKQTMDSWAAKHRGHSLWMDSKMTSKMRELNASRKKPKRCKAAKTLPLGHFFNAFLIGTNAEIQTKRNPKTFKI